MPLLYKASQPTPINTTSEAATHSRLSTFGTAKLNVPLPAPSNPVPLQDTVLSMSTMITLGLDEESWLSCHSKPLQTSDLPSLNSLATITYVPSNSKECVIHVSRKVVYIQVAFQYDQETGNFGVDIPKNSRPLPSMYASKSLQVGHIGFLGDEQETPVSAVGWIKTNVPSTPDPNSTPVTYINLERILAVGSTSYSLENTATHNHHVLELAQAITHPNDKIRVNTLVRAEAQHFMNFYHDVRSAFDSESSHVRIDGWGVRGRTPSWLVPLNQDSGVDLEVIATCLNTTSSSCIPTSPNLTAQAVVVMHQQPQQPEPESEPTPMECPPPPSPISEVLRDEAMDESVGGWVGPSPKLSQMECNDNNSNGSSSPDSEPMTAIRTYSFGSNEEDEL